MGDRAQLRLARHAPVVTRAAARLVMWRVRQRAGASS
jgi:hypothetical protein